MAERMTSPEEAAVLQNAVRGLAKDFERMGFDRGQIGSALAGIGLGMVQVHISHDQALHMVNTLRDLLMVEAAGPLS